MEMLLLACTGQRATPLAAALAALPAVLAVPSSVAAPSPLIPSAFLNVSFAPP